MKRGSLLLVGSRSRSGSGSNCSPWQLWILALGPVKAKKKLFLSLICSFTYVLLLLLLLNTGTGTGTGTGCEWHPPHPPPPLRRGYSILINTWQRNDLLRQSVVHYASCAGVVAIHIVWSEPEPPPDSLRDALRQAAQLKLNSGKAVEILFDLNQENSLNNRFKEIKDLRTDAIFSLDDDVIFPCTSVEFAFSVWQSSPTTMVGFVPRIHWLCKSSCGAHRYTYGGWWSVWWVGTYSMVLSKAAFFHRKYLDLYTNHMPASIRDFVTQNRNCEDIAMSFLVANITGAPPIWVKGRVLEMRGSTGISSLKGHNEKRSWCLNVLAALYGHIPLVSTNIKAIDSRYSWFW